MQSCSHILFFASDYKIGLSSLLTHNLIALSRQKSLKVTGIAGDIEQFKGLNDLLTLNQINRFSVEGLDIHANFIKLSKDLLRIIQDEKPQYIHVQNNWQLALVVFIKLRYWKDFRIIYTIHGYRHNQYIKSLIAKTIIDMLLFFTADIVFAPTSYVRKRFPFIRHKSHTLFLGVEERYFESNLPDFNKLHKNIIFAGQFRHGKNQKVIIEALSKNLLKTGNTDFTLYLPGDGPLKNELIEHVENFNLKQNVVFPGQLSRNEIFDLYSRCHIAVIPTNYETFGHCIAEPFVMGLCVMTRNVGIAQDIICEPINGLLFENENDLAILLEKYLNNCEALERIGQKAYEMRNLLRWDLICLRYSEILRQNMLKHEPDGGKYK